MHPCSIALRLPIVPRRGKRSRQLRDPRRLRGTCRDAHAAENVVHAGAQRACWPPVLAGVFISSGYQSVPGGGIMASPSAAVSAACSSCTCPRCKVTCMDTRASNCTGRCGITHDQGFKIRCACRHTCSRSTRAPVITTARHVASASAVCRRCTSWPPTAAKPLPRHRDLSSCRLALAFDAIAAGLPPERARLSVPPAAGC